MAYTYKQVPNAERNAQYHESKGLPFTMEDLVMLDQFEILDPDGDRVIIVHSETEAEGLLSHLNR